jgi:N-acetylneuraminic acid mutarotase
MSRSRTRLVLRVAASIFVLVLLAITAAIVVLRVTNPDVRDTTSWSRLADMPQQRGETASAAVGARLVVAGGLYGVGRAADSVYVYDSARNEWSVGRRLPGPRHHAAAAGLGGHVYVSGGASSATDWAPTDTFWRAEPGGAWRALSRMPEGRQGHAMAAVDGRLYVVGGVGPSSRTLIYDPMSDRWSTGAPLPLGRNHLRAVAWGGEVWAIGGRDRAPTTRVDIYSPKTDTWRPGPELPSAMSAMAVGVLADGLHVVGGEDPATRGGRVIHEHYVIARGERRWSSGDEQMLPVHGAGYGVISRRLIVAGGATRQGVFSTVSWTAVTQRYRPSGYDTKHYES